MAVKATEVVEAARQLLGSPYRWWDGAWPPPAGSPFYMDGSSDDGYTPKFVKREGINCTGLINWARAECGLESIGGTLRYRDWLEENGKLEGYDPTNPGLVGTLMGHPFEEGRGAAEGHIAMISSPEQYIIQADASRGVNEDDRDWETHEWADFTYYGLMPDVQYSEATAPKTLRTKDPDVDVMARTIFGEARNQAYVGRVAVGWAIKNRAEFAKARGGYWWGNTIKEVCLKPWQFSCWNANDPNRNLIKNVKATDPNFSQCLDIARKVVSGQVPDPVAGATHYYAEYIAPPPWVKGATFVAKIGVHLFYKGVS